MFRYYYISCICFLQLATIISSYAPLKRAQHIASYVNNKIYFHGGSINGKTYTNDFFYLDVSRPFTLDADLPIVDLNNKVPFYYSHAMATSTVCGSNKDTIFLFGGQFYNKATAPLVFAFDTSNPIWLNVNSNDNESKPIRRALSTGVCYKNSKICSFGGSITDNNVTTYSNDLDILDTNQLIWLSGSKLNSPPPMDAATATLLLDGRIVYLGGNTAQPLKFVGMSEIYIYDINSDKWSTMITNGVSPEPRVGHTAVLTQDGRIIVFGGILENSSPAPNPLLVLDTTVQPSFRWSIPNANYTPSFAPNIRHTATLVGNYMIVAFGFYAIRQYSNQIYMLDVSDKNNYKWVTRFIPVGTTTTTSHPSTRLGAIIGGTIGGIVVMVVSITIIFLLHHKYKRNKVKMPHAIDEMY